MDYKKILRRLRLPRTIFYKIKFKQQIAEIPEDIFEKSIERIENFKDKYKGERCFVIGNGPSLKTEDLDKLKDEYCFATNRIFKIYDKTDWRPTFFCVQDDLVLESILDDVSNVIEQSVCGFVSSNNYERAKESLKSVKNMVWMPFSFCPPKKNLYPFSTNASKQVFEGLTVTYSCMQLAAYMGFSEIYLLGVDHNYPVEVDCDGNVVKDEKSVKAYFGEALVSMSDINLPQVIEMTRAYISAEKYSRKNGFRIYNATRGGKLEVFERVDFDELF